MIAIEVYINGEYVVTAGQDDWSVLAAHVTATRSDDEGDSEGEVRYSIGGLSKRNSEGFGHHFRWKERTLTPGDRVEFVVTDSNDVTVPIKRYRSDQCIQEDPFTEEELREMRYQDYLELKNEFDPDVT